MASNEQFDPVKLSISENKFLLSSIGNAPVVVRKAGFPEGVNPKAVMPVVERVYELIELEKAEDQSWAGVDAIKAAIEIYLGEAEKWAKDRRRGRRRFPSLFSYDSRGRAFRAGPGSDAGKVSTYFDKDGVRQPLAVGLLPDEGEDWVAPTVAAEPVEDTIVTLTPGLTHNESKRRFECFCGHTESYKEGHRSSENAAKTRMSRHLRQATDEVDRHREIHTLEFGSPDASS